MIDHRSLKVCAAAEVICTANQAGIVAIATIPTRRRMNGLTNKWKYKWTMQTHDALFLHMQNSRAVKGEEIPVFPNYYIVRCLAAPQQEMPISLGIA
jgi:hypothetical protein